MNPNNELGQLVEGVPRTATIQFCNAGNEPIRDLRIQTSCDCTLLETSDLANVSPGEHRSVRLGITPKIDSPCQRESAGIGVAKFAVVFTYKAGSEELRAEATFTAQVKAAISPEKRSVPFGVVDIDAELLIARVKLRTTPEVDHVEVRGGGKWLASVSKPGTNECELLIKTSPVALGLGEFQEDLDLIPHLKGGIELPAVHVVLQGEVVEGIVVEPRVVVLGYRQVGTVAKEAVRVRQVSAKSYNFGSWTATGHVQCKYESLGENTSVCQVEVPIRQVGDAEEVLKLHFKREDGKAVELRVPVRYVGFNSLVP